MSESNGKKPARDPKVAPPDAQAWDQRPDENDLWFGRFCEFLKLGYTRSVREVYRAEKRNAKSRSVPQSWSDAYHKFAWKSRARAFDAALRERVFKTGNASDEERIRKLDRLIEGLFERVGFMLANAPQDEKFNGFTIDRLLTAMDLMAKHTGGYVERHEITGKDGGPVEVDGFKTIFYLPEIAELPEQAAGLLEEPKENTDAGSTAP
jgi:hypothetical protein